MAVNSAMIFFISAMARAIARRPESGPNVPAPPEPPTSSGSGGGSDSSPKKLSYNASDNDLDSFKLLLTCLIRVFNFPINSSVYSRVSLSTVRCIATSLTASAPHSPNILVFALAGTRPSLPN